MAKWYQADNTTWWWWSWVADLGPYSGPIPPSLPLWVPDAAAELDFVVGIPHPSGDPRLFRDGSYSAGGFSGSYAYHFAPGPLDGSGDYGGLTSLEAGDHLFVQLYAMGYPSTGTLPPKMPPLSLVPSTLIAGGYGPTIGSSHWSAWQEGELHQATAASSALAGTMRTGLAAANGFVDCRPLVQAARANIDAGSGAGWTLPNGASGVGYQEQTGGYPLGYFFGQEKVSTAHPGTLGTAQIAMTGASFDATAGASYRNPLPSVLSGLTEGVDYIADPVTGDFAVYDSGASSTFQGWDDWQIDSRVYSWQANSGAFVNPSTVRIKVKDGVASPGWVATSDSSWSDVGGISFPTDIQSGIGSTTFTEVDRSDTFSLGVLTQPTYSVMAMPELADSSSALGLADVPSGDFVQDDHYMNMSLNAPTRTTVLWMEETETQPQLQDTNLPVGVWKQPRWRYLIPGSLEFHCPGGARPRIAVTEGHWSDWQEPWIMPIYASARSMELAQRQDPADTPVAVAGGDSAAMMAAVQADLKSGGGLYIGGDAPSYMGGSASSQFGASAVGTDGVADASSFLGYTAKTYLGSVMSGVLLVPSLPPGAGTIPLDHHGPHTISSVVDYESGDTVFVGWSDTNFQVLTLDAYLSDVDLITSDIGSAWTPPTSVPFVVGTTAPLTDGAVINIPLQLYVGPDLTYADIDHTDSFSMSTVATGPNAPYTGSTAGEIDFDATDVQYSVPVTLSGVTDPDMSIVLMSGYAGPDTFTVPTLSHDNMHIELFLRGYSTSFVMNALLDPQVKYRSPRWRYWIPATTDIQCEQAVLRLGQRNDGRGPYAHPRLDSSQSAPSSVQRSAAPRLGSNNRYQ